MLASPGRFEESSHTSRAKRIRKININYAQFDKNGYSEQIDSPMEQLS